VQGSHVLLHELQQFEAALSMSGVDFDALRSFVLVAEKQSFQKAALALGISPAALSRRVQRLEAALGARLLERSTRQLALSVAGRLFLPKAAQITGDLANAVEQLARISRAEASQLTLACLPSMTHHLLPRIMRDFRAKFPEIHLRVNECGASAVVRAVRDGSAEFGFTFRVEPDSDLAFELIVTDPYCLALPPDHPLTRQREVKWHELKQHRLITAGQQSGNMRLLAQALNGVDWRPETTYEIDHLTTSVGMVTAGLGIAVLPRSSLPPTGSSAVETRPLVEPAVSRALGIYRPRGYKLPRIGQQLLMTVRRTAGVLAVEDH
jgi:DNA-binding transcriptional LysR family regulator